MTVRELVAVLTALASLATAFGLNGELGLARSDAKTESFDRDGDRIQIEALVEAYRACRER